MATPDPDLVPSLGRLGTWLLGLRAGAVGLFAVLAILLLGYLDSATVPGLAFSPLFMIPLAAAAWRLRLSTAYLLAMLAAATWQSAAQLSGETYSHPLIPGWNTLARLLTFVVVVTLLHRLRNTVLGSIRLAETDSLTGVCNARAFLSGLQRCMEQARETQRPMTLAYIDLDDFKSINDTMGHTSGDAVLRAVATALSERTRSSDVVGRMGGDEFAIALPDTSTAEAQSLMSGLMDRVRGAMQDFPRTPTFSAGVATLLVVPDSVDEVVAIADRLMYEAKRSGKNSYRQVTVGADRPGAFPDTPSPRRTGAGGARTGKDATATPHERPVTVRLPEDTPARRSG